MLSAKITMEHKHKWIKDAYDNGWICKCMAWTPDKIRIYPQQHKPDEYFTETSVQEIKL